MVVGDWEVEPKGGDSFRINWKFSGRSSESDRILGCDNDLGDPDSNSGGKGVRGDSGSGEGEGTCVG